MYKQWCGNKTRWDFKAFLQLFTIIVLLHKERKNINYDRSVTFQKNFYYKQEWADRIDQRIAINPMTGKREKNRKHNKEPIELLH